MKDYYVYILSNNTGTLYIGVTNNLERRLFEHHSEEYTGFTHKYNLKSLVYYETINSIESAILREKQLKGWRRSKKISLIEQMNPGWQDLSIDASATLSMTISGTSRKQSS
jgi:putative endonuclease